MNQPLKADHDAISAIPEQRLTVTRHSERTIMLGTILVALAVSAAMGYVLTQCFSVDVLSSLLAFIPQDCFLDWGMNIGRHCFSDYAIVVDAGMQPNPWKPYSSLPPDHQPIVNQYPAAGMIPHLSFGLPADWLGAPRLGLIGYLLALTIAVLSPAVWAARGTRGLEQVVVFVALGGAAIPAWTVIDRGNSVGFVVPIALVFLVALRRRRWGVVAIMVVLAALVKPQFAVLAVGLFAARQWRWGGLALSGVVISNLAPYLLWPRDFPETITRTIHNLFFSVSTSSTDLTDLKNVSFGRALLMIPDFVKGAQSGGKVPDGFLAGPRSLIGYAVLFLVVASVLALGRRIPPVMVGIVLLAAAAFFPPLAFPYYLVFVLPVAALVVRDPDGRPGVGIFDRLATHRGRRRAVGLCVSLAAALSIAQVPVPILYQVPILGQLGISGVTGSTLFTLTTVPLTPILWLVACAVVIVSYARRPDPSGGSNGEPAREDLPDTAISTS